MKGKGGGFAAGQRWLARWAALFLAVTAGACIPKFERRSDGMELRDCLYHARTDEALEESERDFLLRSCQAVYEMRRKERR